MLVRLEQTKENYAVSGGDAQKKAPALGQSGSTMTCMRTLTLKTLPWKGLLVWGIFGFAFAMIPLVFALTGDDLGETSRGFREVIERGDVYLICVALVGDSLGRFVMIRKKTIWDVLTVGIVIAYTIMVSFEFGVISAMLHSETTKAMIPGGLVQMHSWYYGIGVLIIGCGAVIRTAD
jgi:hypothetical protein